MTVLHYGCNSNPWELLDNCLTNPIMVGVDTETLSVSDITLLGIGVAPDKDNGFYITPDDAIFMDIIGWLQAPDVAKIYHNAPFDLRVLREYLVDADNVDDTAMMARLAAEPSATLEDCSFWVQRQTQSMSHVFAQHGVTRVADLPLEVLGEKCCKDAMATRALYDYYAGRIDMDYYRWIRPMFGILTRISEQGIKLDPERVSELNAYYTSKIMNLRQTCQSLGFKVSSPAQVGYFLGSRGNFLPLTQNGKGNQLVTDDEHLKKLNDPVAHVVLEYRHASKMESTYVRPFIGKERAYTTLRMEAATGRVNSTGAGKEQPDRNLQNIPKNAERKGDDVSSVRSAFIPDNGIFTKMDMSQAELRILAELSQDTAMMELFANDEDIHQWVVDRTNLTRTRAKNLNFGVCYGGDVQTVANFLGMADTKQVQYLLDLYKEMFPQAWSWFEMMEELGMDLGYVKTRWGRNLNLPTIQGEKHLRNCARNYPIQGTAFECMTTLMLDDEIKQHLDTTRLQVHDELIFDGSIWIEGMEHSEAKTEKEGVQTWEIKGSARLANVSGFYAPLEVQKVARWG